MFASTKQGLIAKSTGKKQGEMEVGVGYDPGTQWLKEMSL